MKERLHNQPDRRKTPRDAREGRGASSKPKPEEVKPQQENAENQLGDITPQEEGLEEFRKALKRLGSKDKPPKGFSEELKAEVRRRYPVRKELEEGLEEKIRKGFFKKNSETQGN